jgi:hypothetical protein
MTVCIAATCEAGTNEAPKIVVCVDALASSDLGSVDYYHKDKTLRGGWRCLIAGSPEDANALLPLLRQQFDQATVIDETNVCDIVSTAVSKRRFQRASQLTASKFGLAYRDFLASKDRLPTQIFERMIDEIEKMPWLSDLLVLGFLADGFPIIIRVSNGAVDIMEHFAVIGSGTLLAEASLLHRGHKQSDALDLTLYHAYEAKRHAQRVRTVGDYTHLAVLQANRHPLIVRGVVREYLEEQFMKYGPRDIDRVEMPPEAYVTVGEQIITSPSGAPERAPRPASGESS